MQYQPLAVGRDNGVTALRHDTPISVSQVEDEVMAGRETGERTRRHGIHSRERMTEVVVARASGTEKMRRDRSNPRDFPPSWRTKSVARARGLDGGT